MTKQHGIAIFSQPLSEAKDLNRRNLRSFAVCAAQDDEVGA
jgi:hypothetical protein